MSNQVTATANLTSASQNVVVPGTDLTGSGITAGQGLYVVGEQARYQVAAPPTFDGTDTTIVLTGAYAGDTASGVSVVIQLAYTTLGLPRLSVVARNGGAIMAYLADKVDAILQAIITGTQSLTSPAITGGTVNNLTSLAVAANSDGNVSRFVMSTGISTGTYWTKIFTVSSGATATARLAKTLRIISGSGGDSFVPVQFADLSFYIVETVANGLEQNSSKIAVSQASQIDQTDFMIVQGVAAAGEDIELWMRSNRSSSTYAIYEIASSGTGLVFDIAWNNESTWTATTPSGAVEITSDWAPVRNAILTDSLFVNGNSSGNVSRLIAALPSTGVAGNQWIKLCELTAYSNSDAQVHFRLINLTTGSPSNAEIIARLRYGSTIIDTSASGVDVLHYNDPLNLSPLFGVPSNLHLVASSDTAGTTVEIWMLKPSPYQAINMYVLGTAGNVNLDITRAYQSTDPTIGAVVDIAGGWAGGGWRPLNPQNGYTLGTSLTNSPNQVRKNGNGIAHLNINLATVQTSGTVALTLPEGYRPAHNLHLPIHARTTGYEFALLSISSSGSVAVVYSVTSPTYFTGHVSFLVES